MKKLLFFVVWLAFCTHAMDPKPAIESFVTDKAGNPYAGSAQADLPDEVRMPNRCLTELEKARDCCEWCCLTCVVSTLYGVGRAFGACCCPSDCGAEDND